LLKTYYQQSNLNVFLKILALKKTERLGPEQLQNLQTRRLRKLLWHVLQGSRFYKSYYHAHGITIKNIEDISVTDLPPISKQMMMDHYDDFVCDRSLKRKLKFAFIGATDGHYAGVSLASDVPELLGRFLPLSINSPLETLDQESNAFHPDVLSGYSSGVHLLAQEQLRGNIAIRPARIICTSDPLTDEMRHTIKHAFGREPINFYAASESLSMAAQCGRHEALHLFTDWHIFEAVDDDFRPVAAGIPGNLLLTNLYNYTQPLIRYQMHDEIVINPEPCGCGLPLPTMHNVAGRQEDFLWFDTAEGKRDYLHPIVLVELFVAGLKKFQVIQTQRNAMLMKVVVDGDQAAVVAAIRRRMHEIFCGKKLDTTVQLNLEVVQDIPNDPKTGKYKLIIPLKN